MQQVCLIYNPAAGSKRVRRLEIVERVAAALRSRGLEAEILETSAPRSAGEQARGACERGADVIFACGGDGTIHEVLQGIAFHSHASLGIIPLGSANALARHLKLPLDPVQAALQQLSWEPQLLPLGKVTYQSSAGQSSRYFAVMAGAGADGALMYRMLSATKGRFGRASYYVRAARLAIREPFPAFSVFGPQETYELSHVVSVMAVRVANLGGAFSAMVRGGLLSRTSLRIVVASGPARLSLTAWFVLSWLRLGRLNRYVRFIDVPSLGVSAPVGGVPVQVQADGEWLGTTPMTISVVPDALRLLTGREAV